MKGIQIDSRLLQILLKANESQFNKLEDFAELLGVSTRSIRNYIKQLNNALTKDIAQLINIKDEGYKLEIINKEKFKELIDYYLSKQNKVHFLNNPEERSKYIIKKLIHAQCPIKIEDLAEEINVGRTTLVNDLKKITKLLNIYDLDIKGKQGEGIEVKGNELDIRLLILDFLSKGFNDKNVIEYYFGSIDKTKFQHIKEYLIDLFSFTNVFVTNETISQILTYVTVLISRVTSKNQVESIDKKYINVKLNPEYELAKKIKDEIEDYFDLKINDNEIIFLTLPLLVRKAPINNGRLDDIRISSSIQSLVEKILEDVCCKMGINLKEDKELVWGLEYHLNFALNRCIFNIKINNPLLKDIKKCYPLPYEMGKIAAEVIEKIYDVSVTEDEIGYMALHFGSFIERNSQKFIVIDKVALVCGTGLGTAKLLQIKLRKLLGEDKIISTFSDIEVRKELLNEYDIVFTTVDINIHTETPIIRVNAIFDESEVQKEIEKRYYLKKYNRDTLESNVSLFDINIEEDQFFILEKEKYIDNLSYMVEVLESKGKVDKGFKNRIIEREIKSPTSFDNYISLPHAINHENDAISIAIGILKKPIFWGEKEVRIVILLMIPEGNSIDPELIIKTYEEILKLCQNKNFIENMCRMKSYSEFRELLQKGIIG